jgi:hypothetical protein
MAAAGFAPKADRGRLDMADGLDEHAYAVVEDELLNVAHLTS